jgi:polyhydroxyalkanoate synthase
LAAQHDERFGPATFMVSLLDFSEVGDTAVFMDEPQIEFIEQCMLERGYLDSRHMANMFNLLRSNDLIWSTVVNNYLLGNKPPAFDLLYWNSDGTRMARSAHSFYLRNTYLENNLIKPGKISLLGQPIDLRRIKQDLYAVGAEKDHIVPWRAAWRLARLTSAKVRFVLAASGHIAGMINPPSKGKGGHWADDVDNALLASAEEWLAGARRHEGSWWIDWANWLAARSGTKRGAPSVGSAAYPPICDAPGTYVLEK